MYTNKRQQFTLCKHAILSKQQDHSQLKKNLKTVRCVYLRPKNVLQHLSAFLGHPIHPPPLVVGRLVLKAHGLGSERRADKLI